MKKLTSRPITPYVRSLALGVTSLVLSAWVAHAVPYASCITNNAGTISYLLNQDAQDVKVIYDGGGAGKTNALGAQTRGVHSFSLAGHTSYSIVVSHSDPLAWVKISDETNYNILRIYSPRGVVVNKSTKRLDSFGRIYMANASPGTAGQTTAPTSSQRYTGRGLYAVNPDYSDPFNQGTTVRNAGITFDTGTGAGYSPYKLETDSDGNIYVCDGSVTTGTLYRCGPDLTSNQPMFVGQGSTANTTVHTTILDCYVKGSSATGDLVVYANNGYNPYYNQICRYDINGGDLPFNSAPTVLGCPGICSVNNVTSGFDIGSNGKFYVYENRGAGTDADSIRVFDTDGTTKLFGSLTGPGGLGSPDPLLKTRCAKLTPDGKTLVLLTDANDFRFLPLDPNGLPVYPKMTVVSGASVFSGTSGYGQALSFDAAGNVYAVSSGMEKMVILSPGGQSVAVTSFDGANGSFSLIRPTPYVTVAASQPNTTEGGTPGVFTISRQAPDLSQPLTVSYTVTGTAQNGVDYTSLPTSVVIPANQSSVNVNVQALADALSEPTETVTLTVTAGTGYIVDTLDSATVYIADANPAVLSVASVSPTMYERNTADYAAVTLTRNLGNTNVGLVMEDAKAFTFGGTAVKDADYVINPGAFPIVFNPGDQSVVVNLISPLDNSKLDGNRTVTIGLTAGTDPNGVAWTASTNQVTTTILDDEVAPEVVLWSDNFNTDSSANYTVKFAAQDSGSDYTATFNYDYSGLGVPAAPHSGGDTYGLLLNVNKNDGTAAAAGVNVYPKGRSFGSNFALRFDMCLFEGSSPTSSTEHALFGINHDAAHTNWFRQSGNGYTNSSYDGLWCGVEADASDNYAYLLSTAPSVATGTIWGPTYRVAQGATAFKQAFKSPPFAVAGSPANPNYAGGPTWVDVELSQVGNIVSLRINKTLILQYANTVASTNGDIMLGYNDAYDSIGDSRGVIYDNVRVVQLFPLTIVTQPVPAVVIAAGGATNLSVAVTGSTTGFTNYQWRLNGTAIAGATGSSLALNNLQPAGDGVYDVVVSDGNFSVTSAPCTLLVVPSGMTLGTGTGLTAGYWTNHISSAPYTNTPTLTRLDSLVNFDWGTGSPDALISADNFTARWVGQIEPLGTETYTFTTISDDGARLWVNGQLLVDSWIAQGPTPHSGSIALTGGNKYDLVMEYFEQTGGAVARLYWSNATTVGYCPVPQSQLYPGVAVSPAVALTAPASGASYFTPATIQLAANVTTNNNVVKYVSFYNGGTLLANVTNAPFQYSWSGAAAGSYKVSAAVVYNGGWTVPSATNNVTVVAITPAVISGIVNGTLSYSGAAGSRFVLLKTTDLSLPKSAWTRVATNTTSSGSFSIPVGSEAKAFYTIVSE